MRHHARLTHILTATLVTGSVVLAGPAAGAFTLGSSATEAPAPEKPRPLVVSSADIVKQVREQLAALGVQTADVDKAVTDSIDRAIVDHVPGTVLREDENTDDTEDTDVENGVESGVENTETSENLAPYAENVEITEEIRQRFVEEEAAPLDPNYRWMNDPVSKIMAGKPFEDWVLHRIPGSWFDAPRIPEESMIVQNQDASLYGPGTPIYVGDTRMCTLGVVGTDAQGHKVGITAGHCGTPGDVVWSADSWQVGPTGVVVASNHLHDYSLIQLTDDAAISRSYNGVTVNSIGGPVRPGDVLCKQGVATGHTCGNVWAADAGMQVSQLCAMVGDSGAPVMHGDRMVGMVAGGVTGDQRLSCRTPLQGQLFQPTASTAMDAVLADMDARGGVGAGFRLAD